MNKYGACQVKACSSPATTPAFTDTLSSITATRPRRTSAMKDQRTVQPKWLCQRHAGLLKVDAYTGERSVPWSKSYEVVDGTLKPLPRNDSYEAYWDGRWKGVDQGGEEG